MRSVNIPDDTQEQIFALISGLLSLGNVLFVEDGEGAARAEGSGVEAAAGQAAGQLGLEGAALLRHMTLQSMYVEGKTIAKPQTAVQAADKRDSFAKSIYTMVFSWLVRRINETIALEDDSKAWIGVLDIYGFENFENRNGFEQLLINYANEKLQNHFNKNIFQVQCSKSMHELHHSMNRMLCCLA